LDGVVLADPVEDVLHRGAGVRLLAHALNTRPQQTRRGSWRRLTAKGTSYDHQRDSKQLMRRRMITRRRLGLTQALISQSGAAVKVSLAAEMGECTEPKMHEAGHPASPY
jgi:hypothetical protein